MKNTLYIDCISGIAGDMLLAALIDAGADEQAIIKALKGLPIDAFDLHTDQVIKMGISSKYLHITFDDHDHHHSHEHTHEHTHSHDHDHHHGHHHDHEHSHDHHHHHDDHHHDHGHDHHHRKASDILELIASSELPERVKERSSKIFNIIALSEGRIHGMDPKDVHFHEVGAMDSIIDIIGICIALELLEIDHIHASEVPTGSGKLRMAHGLYPIPAPATTDILKGIPLATLDVKGELTTPTGAAVLKALATSFGPIPEGTIHEIGYGAGKKDFPDHPNVLRVLLMEKKSKR